jgi:nitrate reductase NapE component
METQPEEEEYRAAQAAGGMAVSRSFEEEARELMTLAFGTMILLAILIIGLVGAFALTGWAIFLVLNLVVSVMAIFAFAYLLYRRSRLTMRL